MVSKASKASLASMTLRLESKDAKLATKISFNSIFYLLIVLWLLLTWFDASDWFYSIVPNNRIAANKRIGGKKYPKLIIV